MHPFAAHFSSVFISQSCPREHGVTSQTNVHKQTEGSRSVIRNRRQTDEQAVHPLYLRRLEVLVVHHTVHGEAAVACTPPRVRVQERDIPSAISSSATARAMPNDARGTRPHVLHVQVVGTHLRASLSSMTKCVMLYVSSVFHARALSRPSCK